MNLCSNSTTMDLNIKLGVKKSIIRTFAAQCKNKSTSCDKLDLHMQPEESIRQL